MLRVSLNKKINPSFLRMCVSVDYIFSVRLNKDITIVVSQATVEGRKEMFYLTTHSTHFIYGYMASDIWLRTILIVRKKTRCRHIGYSFRLAARVLFFYMHHPTDMITHTTAFVTPVVEHWLEREIAQWVHHEGSIRRPIAP